MRNRFNLTMTHSDLFVLLSAGGVQIVNGNNEFWVKASDSLKKKIRIEKIPGLESKPSPSSEKDWRRQASNVRP